MKEKENEIRKAISLANKNNKFDMESAKELIPYIVVGYGIEGIFYTVENEKIVIIGIDF